jgi:hypothetical protein
MGQVWHRVRRRAGDTMRADVRQPTQWPAVFWRRAIGAAHMSGVAVWFGSSTRAHMGHAGRHCRMGGANGRRDVLAEVRTMR